MTEAFLTAALSEIPDKAAEAAAWLSTGNRGVYLAAAALIIVVLAGLTVWVRRAGKQPPVEALLAEPEENVDLDAETVAVITAAVLAMQPTGSGRLVVRQIRQLASEGPVWAAAGRWELMKR